MQKYLASKHKHFRGVNSKSGQNRLKLTINQVFFTATRLSRIGFKFSPVLLPSLEQWRKLGENWAGKTKERAYVIKQNFSTTRDLLLGTKFRWLEEKTFLRQVRRWRYLDRSRSLIEIWRNFVTKNFPNFCLERCGARLEKRWIANLSRLELIRSNVFLRIF